MSHYQTPRRLKLKASLGTGASSTTTRHILILALLAALFFGGMAVLGSVIYIPLKLNGSANVTENTPPPTQSSRYTSNSSSAFVHLGDIIQGQASELKPIRITNVSTQSGPLTVTIETTATGITPLVLWPDGTPYSTPAILAPGEHVDLMVGIQTSASTATGAITFKVVFN